MRPIQTSAAAPQLDQPSRLSGSREANPLFQPHTRSHPVNGLCSLAIKNVGGTLPAAALAGVAGGQAGRQLALWAGSG